MVPATISWRACLPACPELVEGSLSNGGDPAPFAPTSLYLRLVRAEKKKVSGTISRLRTGAGLSGL